MLQMFSFLEPIPSCSIYELKFENNIWEFVYAVNTPFNLTNENEKDLIVYEYISDLFIKEASDLHSESINLKFKTLDEYKNLLENQIKTDKEYRKIWLSENPNVIPLTIKLENKNYSYQELKINNVTYISSLIHFDDNISVFAAI